MESVEYFRKGMSTYMFDAKCSYKVIKGSGRANEYVSYKLHHFKIG